MAEVKSFDTIYDLFFSKVTDDLYISLTEEEAKEDARLMLMSAIQNFRYPKVDLKDYSSDGFNSEVTMDEVDLLSELMVSEWIDRQIKTVRLTELAYTGSDAKVLGTPAQMKALMELKKFHNIEVEKKLKYYHYSTRENNTIKTGKLNLTGKR